jgi:hypothetical protein
LILAYNMAIASLGLALATWISRLGRAVAICVSVCVGFSLGWMFLIMSLFRPDYLGIPLIIGSPLYGTVAATSLVGAGRNAVLGSNIGAATLGTFVWIFIHTTVAAILFVMTLATFNFCLGRISDGIPSRPPRIGKFPASDQKPEFNNWVDDAQAEVVTEPSSR